MLDVRVGGEEPSVAANDAVLIKMRPHQLISVDVSIGGEELFAFRCDGFIAATPLGSTAYALSAGGPIVHPSVDCTVLAPICSHALTHRPIIVPADRTIRVALRTETADTFLTLDGQTGHSLQCEDIIEVVRSPNRVHLVRNTRVGYFTILRQKLHWGER